MSDRGGQDKKLVGYFQSDTGAINQLVHLWKFANDPGGEASPGSALGSASVEASPCRASRGVCTLGPAAASPIQTLRSGAAPMHRAFYELGGARTCLAAALRKDGRC